MEAREIRDSAASITLTLEELRLVNNALNEVCNGVLELDDDSEYATRLGAPRERGRELLAEVQQVLDEMGRPGDL